MKIRIVDVGGNGLRRADCANGNLCGFKTKDIAAPSVKDILDFAKEDLSLDTGAVVYCVPGIIQNYTKILASPNVPALCGIDLGEKSKLALFRQSLVCNDVESSATGTAIMFPEEKNFLCLTLSSGLGGRHWINGGIAGMSEISHICTENYMFAPRCGCGLTGCAEAILGGNARTAYVKKAEELKLTRVPPDIHPCRWLDICHLKGESWAVAHYDRIVMAFARWLATVQSVLFVPTLIWKGKVALNSFRDIPDLEERIRTLARRMAISPEFIDNMKFRFVDEFPEYTKDLESFIGAAAIAKRALLL